MHQIEIDYRCASNGILALTQSFPPSCSHQRIRTKVSNKQRLFSLKMYAMGAYKRSWFCVLLLLTIPANYAQNQTEDTSTDSITQNPLNHVSVSFTGAAVSQTGASITQPTESTTSKPTETESSTALPTTKTAANPTKPTTSQATETFPPTTEASTTAVQTVTSANET